MSKDLTKRTIAGSVWSFASLVGQMVLRVGAMIILARFISPHDFGVVSAAMVFITFAQVLCQIGIGPALVQRPELDSGHVKAGAIITLLLGITLGVATVAGAPLAAEAFKIDLLDEVLISLSIVFFVSAVGVVPEALLQRSMAFKKLAMLDVLTYVAGYALVGLGLATNGYGIWALVFAQIFQSVSKVVLLLVVRRDVLRSLRGGVTVRHFRDLLGFGVGQSLAQAGNLVANQIDNFVVGRNLGASALGLYGRSYQLLMVPVNAIGGVGDRVLFPVFAGIQSDRSRMARGFVQAIGLSTMVTAPISVLMVVVSPELVVLTLGPKWLGMVGPFQALGAFLVFRTNSKLCDSVARATGAVGQRAWRQWLFAGMVGGFGWIATTYGLFAVAAAVGIAMMINCAMMFSLVVRVIGVGPKELVLIHARHFCLSAMQLVALHGVASYCRAANIESYEVLAVVVAFALVLNVVSFLVLPAMYGPEGRLVAAQVRAVGALRYKIGRVSG